MGKRLPLSTKTYDEFFIGASFVHLPTWDWRYLKAQGYQESVFDPKAVSPVGAKGIMQFMPKTWEEIHVKADVRDDPFDPEASIYAGAYYLGSLLGQWTARRPREDKLALALASYNCGLGNVLKAQKKSGNASLYLDIIASLPDITGEKNSHETMTYVSRIFGYYNKMVGVKT